MKSVTQKGLQNDQKYKFVKYSTPKIFQKDLDF